MNPAEAVQAHLDLGASESIAMHFGTFQMTTEGIDDPVRALEEAIRAKASQPRRFGFWVSGNQGEAGDRPELCRRSPLQPLGRGHAAGGWASAARRLLSRQRLRRSSRLTSRNLGEPVNNRPFTLLLGSTSCGNRPVRRASSVRSMKSITCEILQWTDLLSNIPSVVCRGQAALDDVRNSLISM